MNIDCPICNTKNIDKKHPYSYHKIKYKDFIEKYYPRFDLFSREKIQFKSEDTYLLTDFNDKRNLKKYLESINKEDGLEYLKNWLLRRKEYKSNFNFNLTEFEAKTLYFPAPSFIEKFYGTNEYEKLCLSSNLNCRNDYSCIPKFDTDINDKTIFCDTREKEYVKLPNFQLKTLSFADYNLEGSSILLERKALGDAINTLSGSYERFKREIDKAVKNNSFILVMIEESFQKLQSFEYLDYIHSKSTWSFISHRIRELMLEYPLNLQFLCVDGRKEFARVAEKIFKLEKVEKMPDFQFLYNIGAI